MSNKPLHIFLLAGEKSGDLHGKELILALKKQHPHLYLYGIGGPLMREAGLIPFLPMEKFQVMGFLDVLWNLPKLLYYFYKTAHFLLKNPPQMIVGIDYPGFNLRLLRHLKRKKISSKLCQFICPSVWAHGKKRIVWMEDSLDLLLSILPFEKEFLKDTKLPIVYVGHPLISHLKTIKREPLHLPEGKRLIALFPGSRTHEIHRNLRQEIRVAKRLFQDDPSLLFALSISGENTSPEIEQILKEEDFKPDFLVPRDKTYSLMQTAFAAIAKSGTVTLELALHLVPTVVIYGVSQIDLFIVKYLLKLKLPFYSLVNILGGKEIFPELFGPYLTEEALFQKMTHFLHNERAYQACQKECLQIRELLSSKDASKEAAQAILSCEVPAKPHF